MSIPIRNTRDDTPFHAGELAVQERAGLRERAQLLGNMFRPAMADAQRAFFAQLPFTLIGSVDDSGQPWASMLTGEPGFIQSPDPRSLVVHATPNPADPLSQTLQPGAALGMLGIQLETRRRNRANGHVGEVAVDGFALHIDQSFGNCPKYIHVRRPVPLGGAQPAVEGEPESSQLSGAAVACIVTSDTCFIASASASAAALVPPPRRSDPPLACSSAPWRPRASLKYREYSGGRARPPRSRSPARSTDHYASGAALGAARDVDPREGVDVSHRGGKRGFVQLEQTSRGTRLHMPDYAGNNAFNTLGNLARHPRAGLLFPDFARGDLLLLACDAEIVWQGPELARFEGAERLVSFSVQRGVRLPRAMPFRWSEAS